MRSCSIEITPDVLLGTDGESVIGSAWDIRRLSDGRFTMAFQKRGADWFPDGQSYLNLVGAQLR